MNLSLRFFELLLSMYVGYSFGRVLGLDELDTVFMAFVTWSLAFAMAELGADKIES